MSYLFVIAAILCAWAILRVLSGEREQSMAELRQRMATARLAETPDDKGKPASQ